MEVIKNIFNEISVFDLIYIIITILYLIRCSIKGFVLSLLSAAKWLLAYVLTLIIFPNAGFVRTKKFIFMNPIIKC